MTRTRRKFLQSTAASLCSIRFLLQGADAKPHRGTILEGSEFMRPLDYGLSFITNPSPANSVRFWLESRTRLIDDSSGDVIDFYQCASCKSEDTFAEKDLLYKDNYDFLPILGGGYWLIFRRPAYISERYREVIKAEKVWGLPTPKLREAGTVTELDTWPKVRDSTADAVPIVSQTELSRKETDLRAIIECPVKTMNISQDKEMYQVDTGPVAYPDLTKRHDPPIACLSLAFAVFNSPNFVDFVIEQATPVAREGEGSHQVYHYSDPFSMTASNRLFAIGN